MDDDVDVLDGSNVNFLRIIYHSKTGKVSLADRKNRVGVSAVLAIVALRVGIVPQKKLFSRAVTIEGHISLGNPHLKATI